MQTEVTQKSLIRRRMLEKRRDYVTSLNGPEKQRCGESVRDQVFSLIPQQSSIIACYMPFQNELDTRPLLQVLAERGFKIALPAVDKTDSLAFYVWTPETLLKKSPCGVMIPVEASMPLDPDIVLAPLVAFDARGHRLGYGHGHYDRALTKLRAQKRITAIGLAYDIQRVDSIPQEPTDERLDWIITEKQIYRALS